MQAESGPHEPLSESSVPIYLKLAGVAGRSSHMDPAWIRIGELHTQRFGARQRDDS